MAKDMKGAEMPQEHFEEKVKGNAPVCGEKYSTEMGNPEHLDERSSGLADYVKGHKVKH